MAPQIVEEDWYSYPQYFDMSCRDQTREEVVFFAEAFRRYAQGSVRRLLEPGCGGGRLVVAMAKRGFSVEAFDLNVEAVKYVRRRLRRANLAADVRVDDMTRFVVSKPADAAFCTLNTFRHLLNEQAARSHLQSVAAAVRPGGLYILGLHLLPLDVDEASFERWTAAHGPTRVTVTLKVVAFDRRSRIERLRTILRVRGPSRDLRIRHEFPLRIYTRQQLQSLLASVPAWELLETFDFWYDIDDPLPLDDHITDTVLVLRRRRDDR